MSVKIICALVLLVGTCAPAFASNNGIELQALANSTNAFDVHVARRQIALCTTTTTAYYCMNKVPKYTEVPPTNWISTTTEIFLNDNAIAFIPVGEFNGLALLYALYLFNNAITLIPVGMLDSNIALERLQLQGNDITSIPVGMFNNNEKLISLYLSGNVIRCSDTDGGWSFGTAISSICTYCHPVGTLETITIGTVDFLQCFISASPTTTTPTPSPTAPTPNPTPSQTSCISKNDNPSASEMNAAMEDFCGPDYATDVGVKGKPEYGGSATMCKQKDQKYETRLHQAMFHGMFGGASSSGRDCKAWCLYDVDEQHRHYRWDNKKVCWKTRKAKARACKDSTNEERGFAADIFDSFCP